MILTLFYQMFFEKSVSFRFNFDNLNKFTTLIQANHVESQL